MALSANADQNQTTSRILNKLHYAVTDIAADITTAATGDIVLMFDASDNYEPKYADATNVSELLGITASAAELNTMDGILATTAELNRVADNSTRIVATGAATLAVTEAAHDKKIVLMDQAAGVTYTLPAATGSGATYEFIQTVIPTSNSNIVQVADATDEMIGYAITENDTDGSTSSFFAADDDDTITFNRTTTGGTKLGERIVCKDLATNQWFVEVHNAATGTEATPFSAAVA